MKTIVRLTLGLCAFVGMGACTSTQLTEEEVFEMRVAKMRNGGEYRNDTLTIKMASINDSIRAAEICEYFQLDTLIDSDATTWDNALSIAMFVAKNIPHNNQTIQPEKKDAISLWEYTKNIEPAFNCRLHSILTYELLQAAGIEARYITCMPEDSRDNDCHVVNHVWLPELNKWAMLDSDMGGNWASDSASIPLSLPEMRQYYIDDKPIYYHYGFGEASCDRHKYYYSYMAKNLFWFSCWETLHYGIEPSAVNNPDEREISLVPEGYKPFGLIKNSLVTTDDTKFWR